jgi:hypothetical protein
MQSLSAYSSSDESNSNALTIKKQKLDVENISEQQLSEKTEISLKQYEVGQMATVLGPRNPYGQQKMSRNSMLGNVESHFMSSLAFDEQQRSFVSLGYARQLDGDGFVGDLDFCKEKESLLLNSMKSKGSKKRVKKEEIQNSNWRGPWAQFEGEQLLLPERTIEDEKWEEPLPIDAALLVPQKEQEETSVFHGEELRGILY